MPDAQKEQRIRDMWLTLPEPHRRGMIDILLFKGDLLREHPELLDGVSGSLGDYLGEVFRGLYE